MFMIKHLRTVIKIVLKIGPAKAGNYDYFLPLPARPNAQSALIQTKANTKKSFISFYDERQSK